RPGRTPTPPADTRSGAHTRPGLAGPPVRGRPHLVVRRPGVARVRLASPCGVGHSPVRRILDRVHPAGGCCGAGPDRCRTALVRARRTSPGGRSRPWRLAHPGPATAGATGRVDLGFLTGSDDLVWSRD